MQYNTYLVHTSGELEVEKFSCISPVCVTFSLVTGIGQLDMGPSSPLSPEAGLLSTPTAPPPNPSPYLLLDTREKDDFDQCHIIGGEEVHTHTHTRLYLHKGR